MSGGGTGNDTSQRCWRCEEAQTGSGCTDDGMYESEGHDEMGKPF